MLTLRGFGGFQHSNSRTPSSALIFDLTEGAAIKVEGSTFRLQDSSVMTRRGVSSAVLIDGGNSVFENVKIFGIDGACPGCTPAAEDGAGLLFRGSQSNVVIRHSEIAGYNFGVDAESTAALTIEGRSQFMSNVISVVIGSVRGSAQVTIQDSDLQDAVLGNIDIIRATAVTVSHNYFETGSHFSPFNVRAGRETGASPNSVTYRGNYLHCNSNDKTPAIVLNAVSGWTQEDNAFTSCPGLIVSNTGTALTGLRFANDSFQGSPPRAYLASTRGVVFDAQLNGSAYISASSPNDDALRTGTGAFSLNGSCRVFTGTGNPNGAQAGNPCDLYLNSRGGPGSVLWVKEIGSTTNTGWVAK